MRRIAHFCALSLALVVHAAALTGCMLDRKPPMPQHTISVTPEITRYLYDGQPMAYDQLQAELKSLADKNRQSATGNARVYIKILTEPGASYDRSLELINYCSSIGLDKIETTGR